MFIYRAQAKTFANFFFLDDLNLILIALGIFNQTQVEYREKQFNFHARKASSSLYVPIKINFELLE